MPRIGWTVTLNLLGTALSIYGAFTDFRGDLHFVGFSIVAVTAGMLLEQAIQLEKGHEQKPAG